MGRHRKLQGAALSALEADWRGTTLSTRELAGKHGIPESTVRSLMAGVVREAGTQKRALVRAAAAGSPRIEAIVDAKVRAEADEDIRVQQIAARNSRGVMDEVAAALAKINRKPSKTDDPEDILERLRLRQPRSLLQLSQANAHALEAWRRTRELDEPPPPGGDGVPVRRILVVRPDGSEEAA